MTTEFGHSEPAEDGTFTTHVTITSHPSFGAILVCLSKHKNFVVAPILALSDEMATVVVFAVDTPGTYVMVSRWDGETRNNEAGQGYGLIDIFGNKWALLLQPSEDGLPTIAGQLLSAQIVEQLLEVPGMRDVR